MDIVYVTRDRERGEGMPENKGYSIIASDGMQDTLDLLKTAKIPAKSAVVVFKNNKQIEEVVKEKGLKLLNPPAELSEKIENKITQVAWLGDLAKLLPPHIITTVKEIVWEKKPFIIQWAHSHTGEGTFVINTLTELEALKVKFPDREARVTEFINGPMFTVNTVVTNTDILMGNISYQITGIPPFTENVFSTIGNDWSVTHSILTEEKIKEFNTLVALVGTKMQSEGWKGLFGVDVIYDIERDHLFLIEINPRQPASTTYESQLQLQARELGVPGTTTFEAHIAALTDKPIDSALVEINDGAQIIRRVTSVPKDIPLVHLENAGYKVLLYKNKKLNADLARIQSKLGIMETHGKFNKRGKEIADLIS